MRRRRPSAGRGALAAPGVIFSGHSRCANPRQLEAGLCLAHCAHGPALARSRRAGVQLVACSTAANAKALLKSAIRSDNPIVFFEARHTASAPQALAGLPSI